MAQIKLEDLPHYVYEDYERWEGRWELVHGIPYAMSPSPIFHHQAVSDNIIQELRSVLKKCKLCRAVSALDWIIAEDT
ncbi:MAG TPA: Uma2 family endonuclease, partial [Spirochaetes bacterium]|nr:Uma2 family endonuclease [Spirochaetota bacterium]